MNNLTKRIALIDGYHMLHRGFYGSIKQGISWKNNDGDHVGAIFIFASKILKMIRSNVYTTIIIAFDISGSCWRSNLSEIYKLTRKKAPVELVPQMQMAREFLTAANIPWFEKKMYEGEDIIATIAKKAANQGFFVDVITNDKDLYQIVTDEINILAQKDRSSPIKRVNKEMINKEIGILPKQISDMKSLLGDSSDNIKGVRGMKYDIAINLINEYHDVQNIVENADSLSDNIKNKIKNSQEQILLNKKIATICNDVDLGEIKFESISVNYLRAQEWLNSNTIDNLDKFLKPLCIRQFYQLIAKDFKQKK